MSTKTETETPILPFLTKNQSPENGGLVFFCRHTKVKRLEMIKN